MTNTVLYGQKLCGVKTFANFRVLLPFTKLFSANYSHRMAKQIFRTGTFSPRNAIFLPFSEKVFTHQLYSTLMSAVIKNDVTGQVTVSLIELGTPGPGRATGHMVLPSRDQIMNKCTQCNKTAGGKWEIVNLI